MGSLQNRTQQKLSQLGQTLAGQRRLLIVVQDSPDPDALASAVALRLLSHRLSDVTCSIAHGGVVGRAENRALAHYLNLNLHQCDRVEYARFDRIALVDTQPYTGNNGLPLDVAAHIVIDHHPCRPASRRVPFHDIRRRYGATSSILWEYLQAAHITPDVPLATALIYGIRSDTQDFGRDVTQSDINAAMGLYPLANLRTLSDIQRGHVPRSYFTLLVRALHNTRVYRDVAIVTLGHVHHADMIAEIADFVLRDDSIRAVMSCGFNDGALRLSVRTSATEYRADHLVRHIVGRHGTGGGHPNYAGGQIPLDQGNDLSWALAERDACRRFLRMLHADRTEGGDLLGLQESNLIDTTDTSPSVPKEAVA